MGVPQSIAELAERFGRNREAYRGGRYNETQLRREFIDPFFAALGWDVDNTQGYAEPYKDVIHEDAIKIGSATKAPDYCFRIGGTRKFFLEAKKPSIDIKGDPGPAYQLRRYAWSAKLPLSILTDFEEFAVYDCRVRPAPTDKSSTARVMYLTYTDYLEKWDQIASIFTREAVLKGSFDKYAETSRLKKGTAQVDASFLTEIEGWRDMLARNIALRNPKLNHRELNFAVQLTIDRIIFLRICEDRGIERYGELMALLNGQDVYERLKVLFRHADDRYNSGLFHFTKEKDRHDPPDELTPNLAIDDKVLKDIFKRLYYPDCPFEFSVLPAEILGQVYEQFLGSTITLTAGHHAKVENKPEVKKAGGVFYTPSYIVDYIVQNTVGKLVEGKTPKQIQDVRILDPACGSGSFLLGAYQYLLDWYLRYYLDNEPDEWARKREPAVCAVEGNRINKTDGTNGNRTDRTNGTYKLTLSERKRILLRHIFGVDIDSQAVEVTKLSLLLKVLEGEKQLVLFSAERALPDLCDNIKCGNSLIGTDFYKHQQMALFDDEMHYKINAFDWEKEFSEVFSGKNPGFDAVIGNPPYGAELSKIEREYLEQHFQLGTTDTAALFMGQQNDLLKDKGNGGFIVPKPFSYASNWQKVQSKLLNDIVKIIDVSKVWKEVKLEQIIYCYQKGVKTSDYISGIRTGELINEVGRIEKTLCNQFGFIVSGVTKKEIQIGDKIQKQGCFLNDFVKNQRGGMLQEHVKPWKSDFQVLGGKQINRYTITDEIKGWISKRYVDDEKAFIKHKSILTQNIVAHIQKPVDHIKIIATISEDGPAIILDTVNQLENISNYLSYYLLGILNSKLINWYVYRFIFAKAIRTMHFDSPVTERVPYPKLNLEMKSDKSKHDNLVSLVEGMLGLHKKLSGAQTPDERTRLQRQIQAMDGQIDALVYELYGLTEEERKIAEGGE